MKNVYALLRIYLLFQITTKSLHIHLSSMMHVKTQRNKDRKPRL